MLIPAEFVLIPMLHAIEEICQFNEIEGLAPHLERKTRADRRDEIRLLIVFTIRDVIRECLRQFELRLERGGPLLNQQQFSRLNGKSRSARKRQTNNGVRSCSQAKNKLLPS